VKSHGRVAYQVSHTFHRGVLIALIAVAPAFASAGWAADERAKTAGAETGPLTVANPGFEEGAKGWPEASFKRFESLVEVDRQQAHSGNVCLRITSRRGTENAWLPQSVEGIQGGATYALRTWVKGDAKTVPSLAALKIEFLTAQGERRSTRGVRRQPVLTGQWEQIEVTARADDDAARAGIILQLFGNGTVWFDDVELIKVAPPGIMITPERQAISAGKDRVLKLRIGLPKPWEEQDDPPLKFTVARVGGKSSYKPTVNLSRVDARKFDVELSLPSVTVGEYSIKCALPGGPPPGACKLFVPLQKRRPKNLSDEGAFVADGDPFFPIGLCHVGPADYARVAKQGFNCVQGTAQVDLSSFGRALNAALDSGLKVDVPLYLGGQVKANLPTSVTKLQRYNRHLAVLSWKIIDQPARRSETADEVPGAYRELRGADPVHALTVSVAAPSQYALWAGFCDSLQVSAYPIPSQPLTLVADRVSAAREVLEPWQNLTVLLQAGWQSDPMNQPTFAQARVMLYLALISGARGVYWYAYRDPGWDLAKTPLWGRFKEINQETEFLAKPLMLGAEAPGVQVESDAEELRWLARTHDGKTFVLLANPSTRAINVTITPGVAVGAAPCLRGTTTELLDGKVSLKLQALGAETVMLRKSTAVKPDNAPAGNPKDGAAGPPPGEKPPAAPAG